MNGILCKENVSQDMVERNDLVQVIGGDVGDLHLYTNGYITILVFNATTTEYKSTPILKIDKSLYNPTFKKLGTITHIELDIITHEISNVARVYLNMATGNIEMSAKPNSRCYSIRYVIYK